MQVKRTQGIFPKAASLDKKIGGFKLRYIHVQEGLGIVFTFMKELEQEIQHRTGTEVDRSRQLIEVPYSKKVSIS